MTQLDSSLALSRPARRVQTQALLEQAATAPQELRQQLLDEVVQINVPVARSVASRYFGRGIEDDDLVQVASLALTGAATRFGIDRERDFLAFAVPTMRGEIKKYFRDHGWMIRPTRRVQEAQGRIMAAQEELQHELRRSPRPSELAERTGIDLEVVVEALAADGCFSPTSLDRPLSTVDTAMTLGDLLTTQDHDAAAAEARAMLGPVLRSLQERDRRILAMRFFEDRTQQEIGEEIGVTQMQVSRLLARIMRDLRRELEGEAAAQPPVRTDAAVRSRTQVA